MCAHRHVHTPSHVCSCCYLRIWSSEECSVHQISSCVMLKERQLFGTFQVKDVANKLLNLKFYVSFLSFLTGFHYAVQSYFLKSILLRAKKRTQDTFLSPVTERDGATCKAGWLGQSPSSRSGQQLRVQCLCTAVCALPATSGAHVLGHHQLIWVQIPRGPTSRLRIHRPLCEKS